MLCVCVCVRACFEAYLLFSPCVMYIFNKLTLKSKYVVLQQIMLIPFACRVYTDETVHYSTLIPGVNMRLYSYMTLNMFINQSEFTWAKSRQSID